MTRPNAFCVDTFLTQFSQNLLRVKVVDKTENTGPLFVLNVN